jgi:hypothetical protein
LKHRTIGFVLANDVPCAADLDDACAMGLDVSPGIGLDSAVSRLFYEVLGSSLTAVYVAPGIICKEAFATAAQHKSRPASVNADDINIFSSAVVKGGQL